MDIYLETTDKKSFASAVAWPGWSRAGRDEASAVQALFDYAPRYQRAMQGLNFQVPAAPEALRVVERFPGTSTTAFGAPDVIASADRLPLDDADFQRLAAALRASFAEYERIYRSVGERELARGPRGGGRDLRGVTFHVLNGAASYLSKVGGKLKIDEGTPDLLAEWRRATSEILAVLAHAAQHGVPEKGPRGGTNWPVRYFIRRLAWHVLDHAWEIEDRMM